MRTRLRNIFIALLACLTAGLSLSCAKEEIPCREIVYNGFGEISLTDPCGYFEITRDDGTLLRVLEYGGTHEPRLGERVYFKYHILPGEGEYVSSYSTEEQPVLDVRVIVFNNLYSALVLRMSEVMSPPQQEECVGDDPIRIITAVFSGNYLNIGFEYFRMPEGVPHRINLVWDDTRTASDTLYLDLRHHAMGETEEAGVTLVSETGLASFRLTDLVPEGADSINVSLHYNLDCDNNGYSQVDKYITGTFHPNAAHNTYIAGDELFLPVNNTTFIR